MAILPRNSDYTSKDFDSIRARLIQLVQSVFPTWTQFQVANFGIVLLEMFSWVGDVLTVYQDNQAGESRIVTARQRRNLLALVKLLGYVPELAGPATTDLSISVDGTLADNCVIAAGQVFRTQSGDIPFQLLAPLTLTPSTPAGVRTVENSTNETDVYAGNGLPSQSTFLATTPFLSIVSVNDGSDYAQVENFLFSNPTDRHYTISVDDNDRAKITFGDNVSGRAPTANVTIIYKIGGGAIGNVDAGTITKVDGTILDNSSNSVKLIVTNSNAATGGADRETAASIKIKAPVSIRAPRTSVAREDFEIHAKELPGVARALMLTHEQNPTGIPDNTGVLYVVPEGNPPGAPSVGLLDAVRKLFVGGTQSKPKYPSPLTFGVTTVAAPYLTVTISARVYLKKGLDEQVIGNEIRRRLNDFFNPIVSTQELADALGVEVGAPNPQIDFGFNLRNLSAAATPPLQGQIAISDIENIIRDTVGVRKIAPEEPGLLVNGYRFQDVALTDNQFPKIGSSILIVNVDSGNYI